jgi:tetratricopeptide (TPR) repeat protein
VAQGADDRQGTPEWDEAPSGAALPEQTSPEPARPPAGDVYDWYRRGMQLLSGGDPAAAVHVLEHAVAAEPDSRSLREALARAQYDARQYPAARENFARLVGSDPADDYAQFGWGLSARKLGELQEAVEHLALAAAMRPDLGHYGRELRGARAERARR